MARSDEPRKQSVGFPIGEKTWEFVKARRARARKVFPFTYEDIAEAVELAPRTVQEDARAGKFNPRDLSGLATYVYHHLRKLKKIKKLRQHTRKRTSKKKGELASLAATDGRTAGR